MPRTEYNQRWYSEHREEIRAKRKAKYDGDPAHREKLLKRSAAYRRAKREVPRVVMRSFKTPIIGETGDGGTITLYSSGVFSYIVRRSSQALSEWERDGIIPRTPYRHGRKGFRFYTVAMMKAVVDEIQGKRRLFPAVPGMMERIARAWVDAGVPVDEEGGIGKALERTRTVGIVQPDLESLDPTPEAVDGEGEDDEQRQGNGDGGSIE